jgi:site-specific recombinase XerD
MMRDYVQPMARSLGIEKKMSWHTFRHTFSSILNGNGGDVKVDSSEVPGSEMRFERAKAPL